MMIDSKGSTGPVIRVTTTMRAPRDKVYKAWTDPDLLKKWFFAEAGFATEEAETDLRPQGAWALKVVNQETGDSTNLYGHYAEVEPGERLAYTWTGACAGEQYWTLVTVWFRHGEGGKGTELELSHGVFETQEDRDLHEQGWFACITCLDRFLEAEEG